MKYVLLFAVVALVLWAMRRSLPPPPPGTPPRPPRRRQPPALEAMVRCSHCGVHLPRSEAFVGQDGQLYCCAPHRSAGPRPT